MILSVVMEQPDVIQFLPQVHLSALLSGNVSAVGEKEKAEYKKRKLVVEVTEKLFTLTKGPDFALTITHTEAELTPEMLQSGSWKDAEFKPYNFAALGITPPGGHLHPLLKV